MRSKLARTGSLFSQFLNVWLYNGSEDESISARSYRQGKLDGEKEWLDRMRFIDNLWLKLFKVKSHSREAFKTDLKTAKQLNKYQDRESGFFTPKI